MAQAHSPCVSSADSLIRRRQIPSEYRSQPRGRAIRADEVMRSPNDYEIHSPMTRSSSRGDVERHFGHRRTTSSVHLPPLWSGRLSLSRNIFEAAFGLPSTRKPRKISQLRTDGGCTIEYRFRQFGLVPIISCARSWQIRRTSPIGPWSPRAPAVILLPRSRHNAVPCDRLPGKERARGLLACGFAVLAQKSSYSARRVGRQPERFSTPNSFGS